MSRTKREFPAGYKNENTKYGRDGQYTSFIAGGQQHGLYFSVCRCCGITSRPDAKRKVTKMRRAYEKRHANTQVHLASSAGLKLPTVA